MTVYHAFVHKERARAIGIDVDDRRCPLSWSGPMAFSEKLKADPGSYAIFSPPSRGMPASPEYNQLDADPAYKKFVISGN